MRPRGAVRVRMEDWSFRQVARLTGLSIRIRRVTLARISHHAMPFSRRSEGRGLWFFNKQLAALAGMKGLTQGGSGCVAARGRRREPRSRTPRRLRRKGADGQRHILWRRREAPWSAAARRRLASLRRFRSYKTNMQRRLAPPSFVRGEKFGLARHEEWQTPGLARKKC